MENLEKLLKKELQPSRKLKVVAWSGLVLFLAVSISFCSFLYHKATAAVREQAVRSFANICQINEDSLTRAIQNRQTLLQLISTRLARRGDYNIEAILDELQDISSAYDCHQAGVLDENKTLYRCGGEVIDVSGLKQTEMIWDTKPHVTESYYSPNNEDLMVNLFSYPLFDGDELKYVLVTTYYSHKITDRMNVNALGESCYTFLLNEKGEMVVTPREYKDKDYIDLLTYLDKEGQIDPTSETEHYFTYKGEDYYSRFEKLKVNDWYLMTCAKESQVFSQARAIILRSAMALGLMWIFILLSILTTYYASVRFRAVLNQNHYHDELLGIPNINALFVLFQRAPKAALEKMYLAVMDIDKFKEFNYIYGNEGGDRLLSYVVSLFSQELSEDYIFRKSDDYFILLDQSENALELEKKLKKIQDHITSDIVLGNIQPFETFFGIRKVDGEVPLRQLISDATFARDLVKGNHLRHYAFYDDSLRERRLAYMEMESSFDTALKNGEFQVYYQPKYDMGAGRIVGAEALARWIKPDGTIVSPGMFIPCFEASRQIIELDETILRQVCNHIREMEIKGMPLRPISVNLSRVHLMQADVFERISSIIEESGIHPKWLSLEITENTLNSADIPLRTLTDAIRSLGCRVEMDDYGVGASGPKALASNCFDVVKLDKSFIDDIGNGQVEAVIENTIQLARRLGLEVIAEGVEQGHQAKRLSDLGCVNAQGYYYSKPLPANDYAVLLLADEAKSQMPIPVDSNSAGDNHSGFSEDFCVALDSASQPIYIIDPKTFELLYCNEVFRRYLGKNPIGIPCHKAIRNLEDPCPNCVAYKLREEGIHETAEYHTPKGNDMLVRVSPLSWRGREYYEVICLDISEKKKLENELHLKSQEYEAIVAQCTAGVMRYDIATGNATLNVDADLNRVEEYLVPDSLNFFRKSGLIDPDEFSVMFSDIREGAPSQGYDAHIRSQSGEERWYHMDYTLIENEQGEPYRAVISFYDNTEQKQKELTYLRWSTRLSVIMSEYTAYMEVNLSKDMIEAEGRGGVWENTSSGRSFSQSLERMISTGVFDEDRIKFRAFFNRERLLGQFLAGRFDCALEYRAMLEGALLWYRAEVQMVKDPTSDDIKASILVSNVDDQLRQERDLRSAAERDAMTGLYNHSVSEALIRQVMDMRTGDRCCLLIIDLDDLRIINSTLGHPEGDRALIAIADCMQEQFSKTTFSKNNILGRMGGDEFVVLLRNAPSFGELNSWLSSFIQKVNEVKIGPKNERPLHASVGAAVGTAGEDSFETLYHQADLALFYTKAKGKNSFSMYKPELEKREFHYKPHSMAACRGWNLQIPAK